jgi:hypothetical protein
MSVLLYIDIQTVEILYPTPVFTYPESNQESAASGLLQSVTSKDELNVCAKVYDHERIEQVDLRQLAHPARGVFHSIHLQHPHQICIYRRRGAPNDGVNGVLGVACLVSLLAGEGGVRAGAKHPGSAGVPLFVPRKYLSW